jgi:hypothetical protein
MLRLSLAAVVVTAAFAQTATEPAPQPPAAVDEALRARITEFYQLHVTGEYRKAEKLVAEDSQDIYYEHGKPKYLSFEIKTIAYSDNFTKAKVSVTCEQHVSGLGNLGRAVKMPSTSSWKVVDGKWFWWADPEELARGPMGRSANAGTKPGAGAKAPAPDSIPTTPDFAMGKVKWEKETLAVKPNSTYQLTITNSSAGTSSLVLKQILPGIELSIDKANLNPGEKAVVTFKTNDNPHSGVIAFQVDPLGEIISVVVKRQLVEPAK